MAFYWSVHVQFRNTFLYFARPHVWVFSISPALGHDDNITDSKMGMRLIQPLRLCNFRLQIGNFDVFYDIVGVETDGVSNVPD